MEMFSDSSKIGWSAVCGDIRTRSCWDFMEKSLHINVLELKQYIMRLSHLQKIHILNVNILIRVDNTTALDYVNKMGGIRYINFNNIAAEIWKYCEQRNIYLHASYRK